MFDQPDSEVRHWYGAKGESYKIRACPKFLRELLFGGRRLAWPDPRDPTRMILPTRLKLTVQHLVGVSGGTWSGPTIHLQWSMDGFDRPVLELGPFCCGEAASTTIELPGITWSEMELRP